MFGKRKCDAVPAFGNTLHAETAEQERKALAALQCKSGADMTIGAACPPSAAALVKAAHLPDAVWMHGHRIECSRCKKGCEVTLSRPASAEAPSPFAVRSKARSDFYALQHAFLPEWFLTKPEVATSILTQQLEGWQSKTMTQIGEVVERTAGNPMPIKKAELVTMPGDTAAVLVDFITPCAPIEAHYALLVGGARPFYLLSEKTHLGEDKPIADIAGLTEWAFTNAQRTDMKHTAMELLPDVSRKAFLNAATEMLKRRLA